MEVKIWPRKSSERGGYICMPLKKNVPVGRPEWKQTVCPICKEKCWRLPGTEMAEAQGAIAVCTLCAIKKGAEK